MPAVVDRSSRVAVSVGWRRGCTGRRGARGHDHRAGHVSPTTNGSARCSARRRCSKRCTARVHRTSGSFALQIRRLYRPARLAESRLARLQPDRRRGVPRDTARACARGWTSSPSMVCTRGGRAVHPLRLYTVWWGGHTYGPRYMLDILPLLVPAAIDRDGNVRTPDAPCLASVALAWSVAVAALGAFNYPARALEHGSGGRGHRTTSASGTAPTRRSARAWNAGPSPRTSISSRRKPCGVPQTLMRVLYFADIRFPLERANGIQTMETCYALAERGHIVHLVVKPDTHSPARDPFDVLRTAAHQEAGDRTSERSGGRGNARPRRLPVVRVRPRVRQGPRGRHHHAGSRRGVGAACRSRRACARRWSTSPMATRRKCRRPCPELVATAKAPSAAQAAATRGARAEVWRGRRVTSRSRRGSPTTSTGASARVRMLAVVPDGMRPPPHAPAAAARSEPVVGYAGHLYAWKGVDVLLRRARAGPRGSRTDRRRPRRGTGPRRA